jgi:hypothetical protein
VDTQFLASQEEIMQEISHQQVLNYRSAKGLANAMTVFLLLIILAFAILLMVYWSFAAFVNSLKTIHPASFAQSSNLLTTYYRRLVTFENSFSVVTLLLLPLSLLVIVLLLFWVYRCARNLRALGCEGLKYTPGWAVGWFLIPVANFVMPILVLAELWKASDPITGTQDWQNDSQPLTPIFWWLVYMGTAFASFVIALINQGPAAEGDLTRPTVSMLILCGWEILWALLTMRVVRLVSSHQDTKIAFLVYNDQKKRSEGKT